MSAFESVVTIQTSRPDDAYTLFESGTELDVHLAGPSATGGTGPILCGFDRFERGPDGKRIHGFSVGGGMYGPGVHNIACEACRSDAGDAKITGSLAFAFIPQPTTKEDS